MSVGQPQTISGFTRTEITNACTGLTHQTTLNPSRRRISSSTPIIPATYVERTKTWIYRGRVYEKKVGKWVKPKKPLRINKSKWRPPKPYECYLEEGHIDTFPGAHITGDSRNPPSCQKGNGQYGELYCADYDMRIVTDISSYNFDSNLEQRAVVKALSKLKGQQVNLAVAIGERAETAELLISTLSGLTQAARSLRKGNLRGVARGLGLSKVHSPKGQTFPQKWLEYQYGWAPLYQDVFGAVKELHQKDNEEPQRNSVSVHALMKNSKEDYRKGDYNYARGVSHYTKTDEGCFVRLDYFLQNPFLQSLARLGITNPVEVAWELVPFSFVVDWFLPVGNYISAFDAALGFQFRGGSCSRFVRRTTNNGMYGTAPSPSNPYLFSQSTYGTAHCRGMKLSRTVYSSSPLPRIPSLKNPFPKNGKHIANAIALFAASLRG